MGVLVLLCRTGERLEATLQGTWGALVRWTERHRRWVLVPGLLAASVLATGLVYWAGARWGPAATSDGLTYMLLARNIAHHGRAGFLQPDGRWQIVTLWPPGYPLFLAALMPWAGEAARAAWWVNLVAFPLFVLLMAREGLRGTGHPIPTVALALFMALAYPVLQIYAWVRAETVFLVQILLFAWALEAWMARPSRSRAVLAGLVAAWATTVRWVGVAFVPWGATVWWWHRKARHDPRGWSDLAGFLAAALVPMAALFLVSKVASGTLTQRTLGWHPPTRENWLLAARAVGEWVAPAFREYSAQGWAAIAVGTVLAAAGLAFAGRWASVRKGLASHDLPAFLTLWGAWAVWYPVILIAAITLLEPNVLLRARFVLPEAMALALLAFAGAWHWLRHRWWTALLLALVWGYLMLTAKAYAGFFIPRWHMQGALWRSAEVQTHPAWPRLRDLPLDVTFYTNKWLEVYFYTDHPAYAFTVLPADLSGACSVVVYVGFGETPSARQTHVRALQARFSLWFAEEPIWVFRAGEPPCP